MLYQFEIQLSQNELIFCYSILKLLINYFLSQIKHFYINKYLLSLIVFIFKVYDENNQIQFFQKSQKKLQSRKTSMKLNQGNLQRQTRNNQINKYNNYKQLIKKFDQKEIIQLSQSKLPDNLKIILKQTLDYLKKDNYQFPFLFTILSQSIQKQGSGNQDTSLLQKIFFGIDAFQSKKISQNKSDQITQIINLINQLKQILKNLELNIDLFKPKIEQKGQFKTKMQIIKQYFNDLQAKKQKFKTSNPRTKKFVQLMTGNQELFKTTNSVQKKKSNFNSIANQIIKMCPQNIFQQILLNRYKYIITEPFMKSGTTIEFRHCCAVFISKNHSFKILESNFHEHKNYHWPIQLASIIKHVKKTIVGFLNTEGGIIYIGMKQQPDKIMPNGIALSKADEIEFFKWVYNSLCRYIYPSINQNKLEEIKNDNKYLKKLQDKQKLQDTAQFVVNQYVSLEFISIVDTETYLDIYIQEGGIYKKLYLVKLKIKSGTMAETFHLLKQGSSGQIECFVRKDASVNKLSQPQFLELYYDRIDKYMSAESNKSNNYYASKCQNCRFYYTQ